MSLHPPFTPSYLGHPLAGGAGRGRSTTTLRYGSDRGTSAMSCGFTVVFCFQALLVLLCFPACAPGGKAGDSPSPNDSESDTDSDTDADADSDADSDADADTDADNDIDGDGYLGEAAGGDDCDDADSAVNPGATEECGNGIDDDCDGTSSGCAPAGGSVADAEAEWTGDAGDAAGAAVAMAGDVNNDGFVDILLGAPGRDSHSSYSGAGYLVLGPVESSSLAENVEYDAEGITTLESVGSSVAGVGDVNADGYDDMVFGAPYTYWTGGAAYLVLGSRTPSSARLSEADAIFTGEDTGDYIGHSVAAAGDVDSDGYADFLVAASGYEESSVGGAVALVLGSSAPGSASLTSADALYTGSGADSGVGSSVAGPGDVDGDGFDDTLIGATGTDSPGADSGSAYLILGSRSPRSSALSGADAVLTGSGSGDYAGVSVAGAGDFDGDGYVDMLVGACGDDAGGLDAGAAYLILGSSSPRSGSLAAADLSLTGEAAGGAAGRSTSGVGDVDADGHGDLLVGGYLDADGGVEAGAAWLVLGGTRSGTLSLAAADAKFTGKAAGDSAGYSVSGGQDVDADGYDDMLIGGYRNDDGGADAGAAWLILGQGL